MKSKLWKALSARAKENQCKIQKMTLTIHEEIKTELISVMKTL